MNLAIATMQQMDHYEGDYVFEKQNDAATRQSHCEVDAYMECKMFRLAQAYTEIINDHFRIDISDSTIVSPKHNLYRYKLLAVHMMAEKGITKEQITIHFQQSQRSIALMLRDEPDWHLFIEIRDKVAAL